MKKLIRYIMICFVALCFVGCFKRPTETSIPDYPLYIGDIEESLENIGLSWTVQKQENTIEDTSSYTLYTTNGQMLAIIDSTGHDDKRRLQLSFMHSENDRWDLTASLPRGEWEKAVQLAILLYGGFSDTEQLAQDFLNHVDSDSFYGSEINQNPKAAVSKWEWTGDGIDCVIQFRQPAGAEQKDLYTICLYNDETYAPQY